MESLLVTYSHQIFCKIAYSSCTQVCGVCIISLMTLTITSKIYIVQWHVHKLGLKLFCHITYSQNNDGIGNGLKKICIFSHFKFCDSFISLIRHNLQNLLIIYTKENYEYWINKKLTNFLIRKFTCQVVISRTLGPFNQCASNDFALKLFKIPKKSRNENEKVASNRACLI